ncbi:MAG: NUDIX domain-containing protein, partial [Deltaproteobacteria bacterium]|nr:NUDIX domain-containing protein [Deltaproteobacteria bacterium]
MIFSGANQAEELLFIRRAERENDPWSGDIAFPGGGIEAQDIDCRAAAERETREEIGLSLTQKEYLGY